MSKKNIIKVGIIILIVILASLGIYYLINKSNTSNKTDTIQSLNMKGLDGIPSVKNQKILQNSMGQDKNGNTNGTLKYRIDKYNGSIDEAVKYFMDNTDKSKWKVEEVKQSLKNNKQLVYKSKNKDFKSEVVVSLFKSEDKLFITLVSYNKQ